jgi:hypothetical protein
MGQLTNLTVPSATGQLMTGRGLVMFANFAETTGAAAAACQLWDGVSTGGQLLMSCQLPEAQSKEIALGARALSYVNGLYYVKTSGTIAGNVAVRLCDSDAEWAEMLASLAAGS